MESNVETAVICSNDECRFEKDMRAFFASQLNGTTRTYENVVVKLDTHVTRISEGGEVQYTAIIIYKVPIQKQS